MRGCFSGNAEDQENWNEWIKKNLSGACSHNEDLPQLRRGKKEQGSTSFMYKYT